MTEHQNALAQLFAACWKDEELKARFMSDPKAVLVVHGIDVPANINVKVVENSDNCVHITLPAAPDGSLELSDEELMNAVGGLWDQKACVNPNAAAQGGSMSDPSTYNPNPPSKASSGW